jgi:TM2 domain-containing membrane protein YozV
MPMVYCRECGKQISDEAASCPNCGAPAVHRASKSRVVAILLAPFLGGLGAHKFYLGRPGWGIVYILFCWTLIPAFVALIELIIYLCTSDRDFAITYATK